MAYGIVNLQIVRDEAIVVDETFKNSINSDLYTEVSQYLFNGNSFTSNVNAMMLHFHSSPQLNYAQMRNSTYRFGYKFTKSSSAFVTNDQMVYIQNCLIPLEETDLRWTIRGLALGRNFHSISGDSISSNYVYKQTTINNMGQLDTIYAYAAGFKPYTLRDGDQVKVSWAINLV